MGDVVKWGLLIAGALLIIGLIISLPFVKFISPSEFSSALSNVITIAGSGFKFARGFINNLFLPFGRSAITGIMIWLLGKWAVSLSIKIATWVYHYIFK